MKSYTE